MASNTIDSLSIQIRSNSSVANAAIDSLITNLTRLNGALNNYAEDSGHYGMAMKNLETGLNNLGNAIARVDATNLKNIASGLNALVKAADGVKGAFNNTGTDKAARDFTGLESQVSKAASKIMEQFGTNGVVATQVRDTLANLFTSAKIGDNGNMILSRGVIESSATDMQGILSKNFDTSYMYEDIVNEWQRVIDWVNSHGRVNVSFNWNDAARSFQEFFGQMSTLGGASKFDLTGRSSYNMHEFITDFNREVGTQFDLSDEADAFAQMAEFVARARRELREFQNATTSIEIPIQEVAQAMISAASDFAKFQEGVRSAESAINGNAVNMENNPFIGIAESIQSMAGIQMPDATGLASLAAAVGMFGYKSTTAAASNIPQIAAGLQSLTGLVLPDFANIGGLAKLLEVINTIGLKKGTGAAFNIGPIVSGLRELSALSGAPFPDAEILMSLAQAFAVLGRETTGRAVDSIPQLAQAFKELMETLSKAPKVDKSVIQLAESLSKLTSAGAKVGSASRSMQGSLNNLSSAVHSGGVSMRKFAASVLTGAKNLVFGSKGADSASHKFRSLSSTLGMLYAKYWMLMRVIRMFSGVIKYASDLTEVQNVVDVSFGKMSKKVEEFAKISIKNYGLSELAAKQYASRFQAMGNAMGITSDQVIKAHKVIGQTKTMTGALAGYDKESKSLADMSINLTKLAGDMASFYNVEVDTVGKALQSGVMAGQTRPLRQYGIDLTNATLAEWAMNHGLNANIKSMTQAEKAMLRYQYVMSQTSNAQGDFARTSGTWHNQIVMLKMQFQQLGAVIGSGLIQAIKPFIRTMNAAMSGIISFAQNVVNALGKIFGWQMEINQTGLALDEDMFDDSEMDNLQDDTEKIGDNLDNATKAAKKFKDQLQGFDKLNVLRTTENTSTPKSNTSNKDDDKNKLNPSGNASGGQAAAQLKKTKGLFESDIDNLFDLGRYINKSLTNLLNSIKWDAVYKKAEELAKGFASFLNGLISPELFAAVGRSLVNSINTVFHFLDSFAENFNWGNLGRSIAAGLNAFFGGFQWDVILSAAQKWGTGIGTTINEAVKNTNFYNIGKTLAKALETVITFWLNLGLTIDFTQIGTKLADGINGAIENFPAKKFADTIDVWVQGIYDLLINTLSNIEWDKLGAKIKEFIENLDPRTVRIAIGALMLVAGAGFAVKVGSVITGGIETALKIAIGRALVGAFEGGALAGLATALGGIAAILGGLGLFIGGFFTMWNKGWSVAGEVVKDVGIALIAIGAVALGVISAPVAAIVAVIAAAVTTIVILIKTNWKAISGHFAKGWADIKKGAGTFAAGFTKTWNDLKTSTVNAAKEMATKVPQWWNKTKTDVGKAMVETAKFAASTWTGIKKTVSEKASQAKTFAVTTFNNLKTGALGIWEKLKSDSGTKWKDVKATVSSYAGKLKENAVSAFNKVKEKAGTIFSDVLTGAKKVWKDIKDAITGPIKAAKKAVETAIDNIKDAMDFDWSLPKLKLPHIDISGSFSINPPRAPKFSIDWYKKAYNNPLLFNSPTVLPTSSGYKGFGDGNGGEMVYGHDRLMDDIRDAAGNSEMTSIGNRQLALLQKQNQILTAILQKEYGISSRDIFNAVRDEGQNYMYRTGRNAFEY